MGREDDCVRSVKAFEWKRCCSFLLLLSDDCEGRRQRETGREKYCLHCGVAKSVNRIKEVRETRIERKKPMNPSSAPFATPVTTAPLYMRSSRGRKVPLYCFLRLS